MGGKLSEMIGEVDVYREELAGRLEREEEERRAVKGEGVHLCQHLASMLTLWMDTVLEDAAARKAKILTPEEEAARKLAFVKVSRLRSLDERTLIPFPVVRVLGGRRREGADCKG